MIYIVDCRIRDEQHRFRIRTNISGRYICGELDIRQVQEKMIELENEIEKGFPRTSNREFQHVKMERVGIKQRVMSRILLAMDLGTSALQIPRSPIDMRGPWDVSRE